MQSSGNSEIPVVIFCGGKGTRLREETEFKPKPMVTVGGFPMLLHIMKIYSHYGFKKFILCIGYKGEMIREYFNNPEFRASGFEITFLDTGEETLTGERLMLSEKHISGPEFMVTYGDGVANIDLNQLLAFHRDSGAVGTITGVHPTSKYGLVAVDGSNRITSFDQKPRLHDYINGGFMVFKKDFFSLLKPGMMIEDVFSSLVKEKQLALYKHEDFWHCMDTYKDYEDLNHLWKVNPRWRIWKD